LLGNCYMEPFLAKTVAAAIYFWALYGCAFGG